MIAPCLECDDRYPGCHVLCEDYAAYRKSCDRIREFQRQHRNDDATQMNIERVLHCKQHRRR